MGMSESGSAEEEEQYPQDRPDGGGCTEAERRHVRAAQGRGEVLPVCVAACVRIHMGDRLTLSSVISLHLFFPFETVPLPEPEAHRYSWTGWLEPIPRCVTDLCCHTQFSFGYLGFRLKSSCSGRGT